MSARHFTIHPSAAETETFHSEAIEATAPEIMIGVVVSAVSGTSPSLIVSIEWSVDGTTWSDPSSAQAFSEFTGTGDGVERFETQARYYRIAGRMNGTDPSFTLFIAGSHFDRS